MNRTRIMSKLFADGAVVYEGAHEGTVRFRGFQKRPNAIGGRQHQGAAATSAWCERAWRIPQVKAGKLLAAAFTGKQNPPCPHGTGQLLRFGDLGTGPDRDAARCQSMHNRGRGT